MNFKYVPIITNRAAEREAIENQYMSEKVLPMVEMVIEKPRKTMKSDFAKSHEQFFKGLARPVIVDIPMHFNLTPKTKPQVYNFLNPIYQNQITRVNFLNLLSTLNVDIIPTISYNPNLPYIPGLITKQEQSLRENFNKIAFRIFSNATPNVIHEVSQVIKASDIFILDIDEVPHTQSSLTSLYNQIYNIKVSKKCTTVIVRSAIPEKLYNTQLIDGNIIYVADNSIINSYKKYRFDAFGDCAGIKRAEIEDIPVASPAYIFFDQANNVYIGYKGIYKDITTFASHVLPNYTASVYWRNLSLAHKKACYGCTQIDGMLSGIIGINSAPKWKTITIAHYIRSIDEVL